MLKINDKCVKVGNSFLDGIPRRNVTVIQTENGVIYATPVAGYDGNVVSLSYSADPYCTFEGFGITGATLFDTNKFIFTGGDVSVSGSFKYEYIDPVHGETVKIGNQIWAKNNYSANSYRYQNLTLDGVNIGTQYYYWGNDARTATFSNGWRVPTNADFSALIDYMGGATAAYSKIKSTFGWYNGRNGTDEYGFRALPVGMYNGNVNTFANSGMSVSYWTSTSAGWYDQYLVHISYSDTSIKFTSVDRLTNYFSIRLIKD